jgi:hypothetical protein
MRLRIKNFGYFLYYIVSSFFSGRYQIEINRELNQEGKLIVSMTTKPDRIHKVWMVIESILRQKVKPDGIFLCLAREEFGDESNLPRRLLALKKRGLQIIFVAENLRPHNKYFYAMSSFPKAAVLTIDDDKIYPYHLVGTLKLYRELYKGQICSVLTRRIEMNGSLPEKYVHWNLVKGNLTPSHALLNLGVGGVLYPPGALHKDLFDKEQLKNKALLTDDIWIKIMALRNDTKVASLAGLFKRPFLSLTGLGKEQLMLKNIQGGENDAVFKNLLALYDIDLNKFMIESA